MSEQEINEEFRMIISHALMGYDLPVSKEDWNLVMSECTKFAMKLTNEKLINYERTKNRTMV